MIPVEKLTNSRAFVSSGEIKHCSVKLGGALDRPNGANWSEFFDAMRRRLQN